ncbi:MAG: nitronate monooxygenase family protein [Dehalococcoidales bacterium]|nr:nitronate monooxygenase family protein [Dehalococcoidales bacterium]
MFKTRITEMFGIEYPIISGPMQWVSRAELVSAVSNAGGLGILASVTFPNTEELRQEIRKTRSLTDKPFAVNVTLLPTARPVNYEGYFLTAIEEGVKIIETSGRSPEPYIKLLKDAGAKVMHRATRTRDIRTAERVGADAVTILGVEAAGHPGMEDVTSLVRIPVTADAVKVPVIAAGGIADARGFVAALALGAEGVLMGTRFLLSRECNIHPRIKEWLLQLGEADTMLIQRSIRNASRVVRTPHTEKILEMEERGATLEELLPLISGQRGRNAYSTGDFSDANMSAGQVVGLIHDVPCVKDIIDGIINEARLIIQRLNNLAGKG